MLNNKILVVNYLKKYLSLNLFLLLLACSQDVQEDGLNEVILAKVGDKTISLAEFVRRTEYTIRPQYAGGSSNIDKKRVLNSLIAEKLLAIEAGDTCPLSKNEHFNRYIEGREQQAMREWLYYKEGLSKVNLDTSEIKADYKVAGRKYKVQFAVLPNKQAVLDLQARMEKDSLSIEDVWQQISLNKELPEKEIEYNSPEAEGVHKALFDTSVVKNQVIGPVLAGDKEYVLMKVKAYTDRIALSNKQRMERLNDVRSKLKADKALKIYGNFIAEIMKGKRLDFDRSTFTKYANTMATLYFKTKEQQNDLFLDRTFNRKSDFPELDSLKSNLDLLQGKPLFTYDGKLWTVTDFKKETERHPLVYRKKRMNESEFPAQFRLAIADMLRDRELAKEAYRRGYNNVNVVKRYTGMWRDAISALYQRDRYLQSFVETDKDSVNMLKLITDHLNPYVDSLQTKYSDQIEINVQKYEEIKLTRIDMFVTQSNVPFPIMVPSFPQLTTDHKLDYGRKMDSLIEN